MRKFKISLRFDYDFEICLDGFNYEKRRDFVFSKKGLCLGEQHKDDSGKLAYIFGAFAPNDEEMIYFKKEASLQEVCHFRTINEKNETSEFVGTFHRCFGVYKGKF